MAGIAAFNPFDRSWWADPYPIYRRLLADAPAGGLNGLPIWYVARFADCEAALRDQRLSADDRNSVVYAQLIAPQELPEEQDGRRSILRLDDPDHARLRALAAATFSRRSVDTLSGLVETTVKALLERVVGGQVEVVNALGYPLPVTVICELLGVDEQDRGRLAGLSRFVAAALDPELTIAPEELARRRTAIRELRHYVDALLARARRSGGGTPLMAALVEAVEAAESQPAEGADPGGAGLPAGAASAGEIGALLFLLLVAGYETTANLIGNALLALARHDELAEEVAERPDGVEALVEEVLRTDPPVQLTSRVATEETPLGDIVVPKGHFLFVLLAAANRDPRQFERPEEIVLDRGPVRNLSFSAGAHHCLGAQLARLEARLALRAVLERWPRLRLVRPPRYRETLVLRGLDELVVEAAV